MNANRLIAQFALSGVVIALAGCASISNTDAPSSPMWQAGKEYHLTILHTNDHHGRFWQNSNGEYGMAARKTLIDNIREEVLLEDGNTLLLSGGDINTGVPESDLQDAEPDFKGMNLLKYDAMALGNHEFDNPIEVLRKQRDWAGFPFLSANIIDNKTGKPLFDAYKIFTVDDLRVAVVGFTTDDTVKIGNPEYLGGITIKSPIEVAQDLIPVLEQKADLIVAVTHMGHYDDGNHGGNAPGDVTLARTVPGIDVIVGGHSQDPLFEPDVQSGTLILQAHEWGKYVGRLDMTIKDGAIVASDYELIPVNLKKKVTKSDGSSERVFIDKEIAQDPVMLSMLQPYQDIGLEKLNIEIGFTDGPLVGERKQVRAQETNLGNLIASAMMKKVHADVAVMNSGGIRDSIPAGKITYKSALQVQPFANAVAYVDFNAEELTAYLSAVAGKEAGTGAFAQTRGVSLVMKDGKATNIKVGGKALEADKTYRVAMNSYTASGGDGYPKISDHKNYVNSGYVDADVLAEYIKDYSPILISDYKPTGAVVR
ncbi:bifunctional UDP-sugar hydrolase/5'-nucleotidase UshA [Marinomonas fungiae]|uniref:2',3'-cyclic-nucleotide 2'-phosphodiesterase/5'-or 3'-nucleotidase, 5'-nucleotidase family n=1 Tax=Marinomonas fungiae TaxID=1137284 RepID=A0A0K6ISL9_9GAMM|nr:bifunctional UDP-sugar hydrolase/5'-nucleotidase UshA [Marinomonas fungiae]CUB06095.1 2',3'-cyclic-nucleotide 2'-phosphodiesterase/5'-or 3'-nucleotidase, 5'-nucleotidase family [Marinomonas fungiae]